ncbi:VOC family protein [Rubellimicrobium aerolatum]|uniref:VOC family protein n=1 Tax=Rubellimicrobium aerolatum TaxID=490979 RepID=A0ABW0SC96_9RHOB|nr:VOC family protein [Rubellimicrobium aerolatum]MBP1806231.1 catechol 2,3-dioxygenase-like lactoylglutathione lyase family enzyme [Rubellimicrobium aerolatum]
MESPSILSHVSIGVADLGRSSAFYDAVLAVLGARRLIDEDGAVVYGRIFPEFGIGRPLDGGPPGVGNGMHFAFLARSRGEVDAFWRVGLEQGATEEGAPGLRPDYGPGYYACFLRDPDGHKIEAHVMDDATEEDTGAAEEAEAHPT